MTYVRLCGGRQTRIVELVGTTDTKSRLWLVELQPTIPTRSVSFDVFLQPSGLQEVASDFMLQLQTWHHVAGEFDGSSQFLYVSMGCP